MRSIETDVAGPRTEIPQAAGARATLVLVNDDDLTYAKVRLDRGSLATVRERLSAIPAPLSRALVWSALWDATRDAELTAPDYLEIAFRQVVREPEIDLLETVLGEVAAAIENYLPAPHRAAARSRSVATLPRRPAGRGTRLGRAAHLGPAPHPGGVHQPGGRPRGTRPARRQRRPRRADDGRRPALAVLGGAGRTGRGSHPPSSTRNWPRTTR